MARRNPTDEDLALDRLPKAPLNRESVGQALALARYVLPYRARFLAGLFTVFISAALGLAFPLLIEKYKVNVARLYDKDKQNKILDLCLDYDTLAATPVSEFMDLMAL